MKRFWGSVLCCGLVFAACASGLLIFKTCKPVLNAAPSGNVSVSYKDNHKILDYVPINPYEGGFVQFSSVYANFGGIAGTTGTFEITLSGGQSPANNSPSSWVFCDFMESTMGTPIVWDDQDENYAMNLWPTTSGIRRTFSVQFEEIGIYRIRIQTVMNGTVAPIYENVFTYVIKNPDITVQNPNFTPVFYANGLNSVKYYSDIQVFDMEINQGLGVFDVCEFANANVTMVNSNGITVDFFEVSFYESSDSEIDATLLRFKRNDNPIVNGEYTINMEISFQGKKIAQTGQEDGFITSRVSVSAKVSFQKRPEGISWQALIIGLVVLGALAGGVYGTNWLIRRSQVQHRMKQEKAREVRLESEQLNLEKMRAQTRQEENAEVTRKSKKKFSRE